MKTPLDFQSIILKLQQYWSDQGCLIWQPYYTQVGAGTMNPATFLRVLGPEPWNVAYVEPSIRPDDGRYGENPNRMQQHYQFQVILKPDPGNPQELYLRSLEAIGINPEEHDIRFVEDNWNSPALGAWGLGWEVWLDGQEITQFTYFQQAGGLPLEPNSVEITYGLERIAIALQGVRTFRDIQWSRQRKYGEVNLQGEQEHSKYYFEVADVERLRQMYDLFEQEAEAALAQGLVLPAHDYVLKCSHTFNVLDTRGAVGVTERQALFSRMRDLARKVAEAYVEQRKELGYPWMEESASAVEPAAQKPDVKNIPVPRGPQDFLLEVGTEELPVADLKSAISQLEERLPVLLEELRLEHGEIQVLGTPRRLVVSVQALASNQEDRTVVVKGPPEARAFDTDGKATKAAQGFARSKGLNVEDLEVREIDGGRYVAAVIHEPGRSALEVLSETLADLVAGIKFERSMRWNASQVNFSRPIRWLLALFGEQVVPFTYAGLQSGRTTRGLRFHKPEELAIASPDAYFEAMAEQKIILDPQERKDTVASQVKALMAEVDADQTLEETLLDEVTQLVERPTALLGQFEPKHLRLPDAVLISVMKKHQRYFPVKSKEGKLMPYFVTVRNGDDAHLDVVADGNEQVIRARFADAAFFIREDLELELEDFVPRLEPLVFQFKLGSMLDKTVRIEKLVGQLTPFFALDKAEADAARRAAHLCKADLASQMVVEMTSLQGVVGQYYALRSGESEPVAKAIFEHYLPRFAGDGVPVSKAGLLVGLADRLDSLTGLFAAGLAPTGTKDPFAQRRAALGLIQNLIEWDLDFDLQQGIDLAAMSMPLEVTPTVKAECLEFIVGRLRSFLIDSGYRYDVVEAVLTAQKHNPAGTLRAVKALSGFVERADWSEILPAYSRCVRITRDQKEKFAVKPDAFVEPAESELYQALAAVEAQSRPAGSVEEFFKAFLPMIPLINRFFDKVLVMDENLVVRENRLGMLQRIAAMADGVVDLSLLEGF